MQKRSSSVWETNAFKAFLCISTDYHEKKGAYEFS